jgi:hypothetical protein
MCKLQKIRAVQHDHSHETLALGGRARLLINITTTCKINKQEEGRDDGTLDFNSNCAVTMLCFAMLCYAYAMICYAYDMLC